jgi:hypothetical protein
MRKKKRIPASRDLNNAQCPFLYIYIGHLGFYVVQKRIPYKEGDLKKKHYMRKTKNSPFHNIYTIKKI